MWHRSGKPELKVTSTYVLYGPYLWCGHAYLFLGEKPPDQTLLESARLFFLGQDS